MKKTVIFSLLALVCSSFGSAADLKDVLNDYADTPHWEFMLTCLKGNAAATDKQGRTLLLYCLQELQGMNFSTLGQALLLSGQNPNAVIPGTGQSALHLAAERNDYRLALRLLAFGANPRLRDKKGRTPAAIATLPQLRAMLRGGTPVELKSDHACDTYAAACEGDAAAQYEMSRIYSDGTGEHADSMSNWVNDPATPDPDAAESRDWLEQAAAADEPRALAELGMRLLWGRDGQQDEAKGRRYLERAAELGNTNAAEILREL